MAYRVPSEWVGEEALALELIRNLAAKLDDPAAGAHAADVLGTLGAACADKLAKGGWGETAAHIGKFAGSSAAPTHNAAADEAEQGRRVGELLKRQLDGLEERVRQRCENTRVACAELLATNAKKGRRRFQIKHDLEAKTSTVEEQDVDDAGQPVGNARTTVLEHDFDNKVSRVREAPEPTAFERHCRQQNP